MIGILLKTGLLARKLFKPTLRTLGAALLQTLTVG